MQVLRLQIDQSPLIAQERGRLNIEGLVALLRSAKRQGHRRGTGLLDRLLGVDFGLFGAFSHGGRRWSHAIR